jgi:hypothetical protein
MNMSEVQEITVDGNTISLEQFQEMQKNPKIKLKEVAPNQYKTLTLMEG